MTPPAATRPARPRATPSHGPAAPLGASLVPSGGVRFVTWAPLAERVDVVTDADDEPHPLTAVGAGWFTGVVADAGAGTRYRYRLHADDGSHVDRPDPAGRHQPDGVHGPSAVDDPAAFRWTDAGWRPPPRHGLVVYELHVGTFTPEGTFDAAARRLPELAADGVTAIEVMPVGQFPGSRNWGYDGVLPWAVQDSYGGPDGLRRLVDAAHAAGIAVLLDVIYNHVGPEGNVLGDFGPYFPDRASNTWGANLNTDGPGADAVRRWVVDNAARWVEDFHVDGLRLDAVHAIPDSSPRHVLADIAAAVHLAAERRGTRAHVIAESDLNDPRLLRRPEIGGHGIDLQWADDFHHVVHNELTGEDDGYYVDFAEGIALLPHMLADRFVYARRFSPFRDRTVGAAAPDLAPERLVVCVQNHDQVGNRPAGDRLTTMVAAPRLRAAAVLLLASPFTPMLFMGEEYGETRPFPFFVSHTDADLLDAVRTGRREEFAYFSAWKGEVPDPGDPATFASAVLDWDRRSSEEGAARLALHRALLAARRTLAPICDPTADEPTATVGPGGVVTYRRTCADEEVAVVALLRDTDAPVPVDGITPRDGWRVVVDSEAAAHGGHDRPWHVGDPLDGPRGLLLHRTLPPTTAPADEDHA